VSFPTQVPTAPIIRPRLRWQSCCALVPQRLSKNYAFELSSIPPSPWAYWQLPPSFITEALLLVNPLLSPSSVSPIPSRPRPPGPSRSTTSPPSSFFIIVLSAFSIVVTSSSGARRARTQTVETGRFCQRSSSSSPRSAFLPVLRSSYAISRGAT